MAAHQGALRRRPHAPAAGDDGAVQEGEGEPGLRAACRSSCRSRCSSRSTRCCSSPSRCGTRRSSAGSRTCRRPIRRACSICSGCIPFDPATVPMVGHFLMIGAWPLIMGVTMWVQMKLNPAPPDPVQAEDLRLDAGVLHLPARGLPGRARDLLGVEQLSCR